MFRLNVGFRFFLISREYKVWPQSIKTAVSVTTLLVSWRDSPSIVTSLIQSSKSMPSKLPLALLLSLALALLCIEHSDYLQSRKQTESELQVEPPAADIEDINDLLEALNDIIGLSLEDDTKKEKEERQLPDAFFLTALRVQKDLHSVLHPSLAPPLWLLHRNLVK